MAKQHQYPTMTNVYRWGVADFYALVILGAFALFRVTPVVLILGPIVAGLLLISTLLTLFGILHRQLYMQLEVYSVLLVELALTVLAGIAIWNTFL